LVLHGLNLRKNGGFLRVKIFTPDWEGILEKTQLYVQFLTLPPFKPI
jgi:hypothetical protein